MLAGLPRSRRESLLSHSPERAAGPTVKGAGGNPRHALRAARLRGPRGRDAGGGPGPASPRTRSGPSFTTDIRPGGEWIETRLLAAGERTNPWFRSGGRPRGPAGRHHRLRHRPHRPLRLLRRPLAHLVDRRRRAAPDGARTTASACEQIAANTALLRPGTCGFAELHHRPFALPEAYRAHLFLHLPRGRALRRMALHHLSRGPGAGRGSRGCSSPGMVALRPRASSAARDGDFLDQARGPVLVTEAAPEVLSRYPPEAALFLRAQLSQPTLAQKLSEDSVAGTRTRGRTRMTLTRPAGTAGPSIAGRWPRPASPR